MLPLTEDKAKAWLRRQRFPVPQGEAAATPEAAAEIARRLGGGAVVKALVPTGRRGKAGAVKLVDSPEAAAEAASAMLGSEVQGYRVAKVYVEAKVDIAAEYYLSIALESFPPKLLLSREGGVDIEQTQANHPSTSTRPRA